MSSERLIKIAFDQNSGEIIDADKAFNDKTEAHAFREEYSRDKYKLVCPECDNSLTFSTSKCNRMFFKHKVADCILSNGKLSPKELQNFTSITRGKESDRHIYLKNEIGKRLKNLEGIHSIAIDNKCIIREGEKRRPDVYCRYYDKELVFEIQLSDLSLRYILSRHDFYKKHGIYLIWILDKFDKENQFRLDRDIKYLTKYQNFFKLDENTDIFKLECDYKVPYIDDELVKTHWKNKSIGLSQVRLDTEAYQIYYYNFGDNYEIKDDELRRYKENIIKEQRQREETVKENLAKTKVQQIIHDIKSARDGHNLFLPIKQEIFFLTAYETLALNNRLQLATREKENKPILNHWINTIPDKERPFIEFLLDTDEILLNVNRVDGEEKTAYQELFTNKNILYPNAILKGLLRRGYELTSKDQSFSKNIAEGNKEFNKLYILCEACCNLSDKTLVDDIFRHDTLVFIFESARRKNIVGFNFPPNAWIQFANNAIEYYGGYWEYIERAFKSLDIWDELLKADKKSSFHKKVEKFYLKVPEQNYDFDEVFRDLYPDLSY